jgi:hypothetical protein
VSFEWYLISIFCVTHFYNFLQEFRKDDEKLGTLRSFDITKVVINKLN